MRRFLPFVDVEPDSALELVTSVEKQDILLFLANFIDLGLAAGNTSDLSEGLFLGGDQCVTC